MHPTQNGGEFARLLTAIQERTGMSDQAIGDVAGVNRSQVWRWTHSGSAPGYEPVRRLAAWLAAERPEVADMAVQLLPAAGYAAPFSDADETRRESPVRFQGPLLSEPGSLPFPVDRDMAARSAPHIAEINGRLAVWARGEWQRRGEAAIGAIPDGETLFPDRPQDARVWDAMIEQGFLGEKYTLLQLVQGVAIKRVQAEDRRQGQGSGGVAAGLMRRLTRTGRNPPDVTIRSHSAVF